MRFVRVESRDLGEDMGGTVVWFRTDLRIEDNPAFVAAVERGEPVLPVFLWSPQEEGDWAPGAASRWWLHQSLEQLTELLAGRGLPLVLRRVEDSAVALIEVATECGADAVYWNRRYEPVVIARDTRVKAQLRSAGLGAESFNSTLLFEPWEIKTKTGGPYKVYTPFLKACLAAAPPSVGALTENPRAVTSVPRSEPLSALELEPKLDWSAGMRAAWKPGRQGALHELDRFLDEVGAQYDELRNRPDQVGTSRLSPYLHFGEIGVREVWQRLKALEKRHPSDGLRVYGQELIWREFAHHLLFHFPHTVTEPLRPEFARFPWSEDAQQLRAWQRGKTGYPFVDAGMRELWTTGWMHNRVRMVVASFLIKHLLIPWQRGAEWFWDTLLDADLASNTMGWQWTAGSGADAAPYFRIFNPVSQGERFDPGGVYVRRWCPELARLPDRWIHRPWEAPAPVRAAAGLRLGEEYPLPLVDHNEARGRALEAYDEMRESLG